MADIVRGRMREEFVPTFMDYSLGEITNIPPGVREALESLPTNLNNLLTDEDRAEFAKWVEMNRLRRTQIAMETGIPMNEVG